MVITRFVFEWFAGINCIIFTVANTRFKIKFATIKWYNLCLQIIQLQTCYPLISIIDWRLSTENAVKIHTDKF